MSNFDSLEKVKELYKKVGLQSTENNYFVTYKNVNKQLGMANGMKYPYDGLLINMTENGLGIFYLKQEGIPLTYNINKMNVDENSYFFITNEDIRNITVRKFALLNNKKKSITIKDQKNGKTYEIYANIIEKDIDYHENGFSKFIERYSK